eukprot:COSAG06_NODE_32_length_31260_cov_54.706973_1_plen_244_part_00
MWSRMAPPISVLGLTGLSKDGDGPEIIFRIWKKAKVTSQKDRLRLAFPGLSDDDMTDSLEVARQHINEQVAEMEAQMALKVSDLSEMLKTGRKAGKKGKKKAKTSKATQEAMDRLTAEVESRKARIQAAKQGKQDDIMAMAKETAAQVDQDAGELSTRFLVRHMIRRCGWRGSMHQPRHMGVMRRDSRQGTRSSTVGNDATTTMWIEVTSAMARQWRQPDRQQQRQRCSDTGGQRTLLQRGTS